MIGDQTVEGNGRTCVVFALAACFGVIGISILSQFSESFVLDDAYMFVRYADNVLSDGRLSWNPGGEATYGLTSCLNLGVVLAVRVFVSENPALAAGLSSLVSGILFVFLLARLLGWYTDTSPAGRSFLILMGFFSLAATIPYLASHFVSGMDTAFAFVFLTSYIIFCRRYERLPSGARVLWMGLWGGLAFFARPDLMLYTFFVPVSMVLFGSDRKAKRDGLLALGLTVVVTGAQVGFASLYFNSALPLPFYSKGMRLYSEYLIEQYRLVPFIECLEYIASYWYLFLIVGADFVLNFRRWRSGVSAVEKGLAIATGFFIFYYLFFVLQIMHRSQRFYYPTLPALLFLAAQGAVRLFEKVPDSIRQAIQQRSKPTCFVVTFFLLGLLFPPALSVAKALGKQVLKENLVNFDLADSSRERFSDYWFKLDMFSGLPDDLVMATSEVGRPAAMNPEKRIVDLTGLNETAFAHNGFSADRLFQTYRPDLIYMPHPHYKGMIEQISNHPYFIGHYEYFPASALGAVMGVALRRDSRYYSLMHKIVTG